MTPAALRDLIAKGESLDVEFKGEERTALSDGDLVEAVVCLANRSTLEPGWLLVGVEDDGRVTGARPRHGEETDPWRLQALIGNRTRPAASVRAQVIEVAGKSVVAIEVAPSPTAVATSAGKFVRRALDLHGLPQCIPMGALDITSRASDLRFADPLRMAVEGLAFEDLARIEFDRLRQLVSDHPHRADAGLLNLPDMEVAKALGAVEEDRRIRAVTVLGVLLFGDESLIRRHVPAHEVAFQRLSGLEVRVNDFFRWPLFRVMEEILARHRALYLEDEIFVRGARIGVPNVPNAAFREAIANALIHRDYTRLGAVHVQWHEDDGVEVSSPGGLPAGVRIDNLLVTAPRPRNPHLADAFKRAGLVERNARGIDTIFLEQLRTGRPPPRYDRTNEAGVTVILPGRPADLRYARLVAEHGVGGRPLTLDDHLILWLARSEAALTTAEAARAIQKPEPDAAAVVAGLVAEGLLEPDGSRGAASRLSATARREIAAESGKSLEGLNSRERAVMERVRAHGRIARRDVMSLLTIDSKPAQAVLARLVERGILERRGERKAAHYVERAQPTVA